MIGCMGQKRSIADLNIRHKISENENNDNNFLMILIL